MKKLVLNCLIIVLLIINGCKKDDNSNKVSKNSGNETKFPEYVGYWKNIEARRNGKIMYCGDQYISVTAAGTVITHNTFIPEFKFKNDSIFIYSNCNNGLNTAKYPKWEISNNNYITIYTNLPIPYDKTENYLVKSLPLNNQMVLTYDEKLFEGYRGSNIQVTYKWEYTYIKE